MATFRDRFYFLRYESRLRFEDIANLLDISKSTLSRTVNGEFALKQELIEKLCDLFKCSADFLLGRTNVKEPDKSSDIDPEYFILIREAQEKKIPPEQLRKLLDFVYEIKESK
jgi:transcriptional regulator with XRE-family HTH domain